MEGRRRSCRVRAAKVGWQAEHFWEPKDQIYGGISWTSDPITQIWYPSSGFLEPQGRAHRRLYVWRVSPPTFNAQPIAERCAGRKSRATSHTTASPGAVGHGLAIGWNNMEFERMAWADEAIRRLRSTPKFCRSRRAAST